VDEEQHVVGHQPTQREHFRGEKVGPTRELIRRITWLCIRIITGCIIRHIVRWLTRQIGRLVLRRPGVGDSTFVVSADGRVTRSPIEYAVELIAFLQHPDYELLHGQYVSSKSLEKEFYPRFLKATGWAPMPWRTVSIELGRFAREGKLTHKRDQEFRCAGGRKWKRRSINQFLVPHPKA
jgi:hypothetical protein